MAHGPRDLNALYKRMREVSGYLREDAAALEALVGEVTPAVMLRVVTTGDRMAGRERKSPQMSPQGTGAGGLSVMAREGIEPPTRGFSVRCSTN
jgi:hypothetical protein